MYRTPTTLCFIAHQGDLSGVQQWVGEGRSLDSFSNGHTALMVACSQGHLEVAKLLLDSGAKVDLQDERGFTALHHAAMSGSHDLIRMLVNEYSSNINITAASGFNVLRLTCAGMFYHSAIFLLESGGEMEMSWFRRSSPIFKAKMKELASKRLKGLVECMGIFEKLKIPAQIIYEFAYAIRNLETLSETSIY